MKPHTPVTQASMGQKNRHKKAKKPNKQIVQNRPQNSEPLPATVATAATVTPASLKGGVKPATLTEVQGDYIRTDIIRILAMLGVVAVILGGLFALDSGTDYLHDAGRELSSFLKLQ
jgi:hypothetical protein